MGSRNGPSRAKKTGKAKQGRAPPKFYFAAGEVSLPRVAKFAAVSTNDSCAGRVVVPVPSKKEDYSEGTIVGWVITASFVENGKAKFVGGSTFSSTVTIKVPADMRDSKIYLDVAGGAEETYGVCFSITPKLTNDITFHVAPGSPKK